MVGVGRAGGERKLLLCLSVSGEGAGVEGVAGWGVFCPVALDLLVTQKREKKERQKESG